MTGVLLVSRFVQFAAVIVLLGGSLFSLYAITGLSGVDEVEKVFERWLRRVLSSAAVFAFLSSLTWLSVEAAIMGDGWSNAVSSSTLSTVLLRTEFGRVWIVHLAIAGILLITLVTLGERMNREAMTVIAGLSAVLVASLAWSGHAVGGADPRMDLAAQVIHLLAASLWLGGLVPLGYVLLQARRDTTAWLTVARFVLPRYSQAGLVAVSLLLLTGIFSSWSLVGSINALTGTPYGRVLLLKIALFALMACIALANRLDLMPKMMHPGASTDADKSLVRLSRNVVLEQVLGITVLAAVSVLGVLPPGEHSENGDATLVAPSSYVALGWPTHRG